MIKQNYLFQMVLFIALVVCFTACNTPQNEVASSENIQNSLDETVDVFRESEKPDQSDTSTQENESNIFDSSADSNASSSLSSNASEQSMVENQIVIAVKPVAAEGEFETFYITNSAIQNKIIDFLAAIQSTEPASNPMMGGYFYDLSVTHNGVTEAYHFSNHDNTPNGHYRIYKNDQPYTVDPALWDAISLSFPLFATDNKPHYTLEVFSSSHNSTIGMAHFDAGKAVWSETEQERTSKIFEYINGMIPNDAKTDVEQHNEYIRISIFDWTQKSETQYICYNSIDEDGLCLVKSSDNKWFAAESSFYGYLNSFWQANR